MHMRVLVVFIVYFGELPNWLPLTLQSMHVNPGVDFVVITDADAPPLLPTLLQDLKAVDGGVALDAADNDGRTAVHHAVLQARACAQTPHKPRHNAHVAICQISVGWSLKFALPKSISIPKETLGNR